MAIAFEVKYISMIYQTQKIMTLPNLQKKSKKIKEIFNDG